MSGTQRSAALRSFEAQWLAREPDALSGLREQALRRFLKLGLPTTRDESWRYTSLRPLAAQSFVDAPRAQAAGFDPRHALVGEASRALLGDHRDVAQTLVLVNGHPLNPTAKARAGLEVRTLDALSRENPDHLMRHLEPLSDAEELRWLLLNTALGTDGLHLTIKESLAAPVLILHIGAADRPGTASYPRVIVDVAAGASATLLEHHVQHGSEAPMCNSATLLALERNARIEHYRVFATGDRAMHFDTLQVRLERDAECRQFTAALGGGLVRASLDASLREPGARLESYSLLPGHSDRHVDCVNVVKHAAARTVSRQTARAIASGASRVIFNSKVVVDAGASQSDSQQSCRGLLLSPSAEIDSRPQLEIHTDDVKCAHGATTGRLDPDMLFYMLSRGIERRTAQSLLVFAFLADVLTGMSESAARAAIESDLIRQLPDSQMLQEFR
jgi:Fe-S cluster assembly protein SufD